MLRFSIAKWSAWSPSRPQTSDWEAPSFPTDSMFTDRTMSPDVKEIPMMARRRLSRFGKMAARVTLDILDNDNKTAPLVFSSRYGEASITANMLQLICEQEPLSPTAFSLSVHNAVPGFLSIHNRCIAPHTAIAAGTSSFATGLLEAVSQLNSMEAADAKVIFTHCDEPLPLIYPQETSAPVPSMALSMVLSKPNTQASILSIAATTASSPASEDDAALSFVHYLACEETDWHWHDTRSKWSCTKYAA